MLKRTAVVALFALVLTATASAGNGAGPNKSSSSSISLVLMSASASTTSTSAASGPYYGDTVTFAVSTTATSQPFVHLKCYRSGNLVLEAWQGFFEGALGNQSFRLGPTLAWQSGAA